MRNQELANKVIEDGATQMFGNTDTAKWVSEEMKKKEVWSNEEVTTLVLEALKRHSIEVDNRNKSVLPEKDSEKYGPGTGYRPPSACCAPQKAKPTRRASEDMENVD